MDPASSDLADYAAAVGELVLHLRDEGAILSSIDQHLVATWWERGYPLPVVLRAVRETGERLKRRKRPPRGLPLKSMSKQVEREGERALERGAAAVAPSPASPSSGAAESVLDRALARLRRAPRRRAAHAALLDEAAQSLRDAQQGPPGLAFVALLAASRCYYDGLFASLPPEEQRRLRDEIEGSLPPRSGRESLDARDEAVRELVRRRLRERDPVLDPLAIEGEA